MTDSIPSVEGTINGMPCRVLQWSMIVEGVPAREEVIHYEATFECDQDVPLGLETLTFPEFVVVDFYPLDETSVKRTGATLTIDGKVDPIRGNRYEITGKATKHVET